MAIPKFVRDWARQTYRSKLDEDEYVHEIAASNDWQKVSDEIVGEDKYSNVNELVYLHLETGRYVRFSERSLPYGIDDYGMEEDDEDHEIEEVLPEQVTVTVYRTRREQRKAHPRG